MNSSIPYLHVPPTLTNNKIKYFFLPHTAEQLLALFSSLFLACHTFENTFRQSTSKH